MIRIAAWIPVLACLGDVHPRGWAAEKEGERGSKAATLSQEANLDFSCVGGAKSHLGATPFGRMTEESGSLKYVASDHLNKKILYRLGVDWQRFSFGLPPAIPLPNTLQSMGAVVGADFEISDEWLMRIETEPGVYSDFQDIGFDDVNAPVICGFSYLVDDNLQWVFGVSADIKRNIPVVPAAGVRWKFADQWTLMAILPRPRLNHAFTDSVTLYAGGEIKSGTYRVAKDFGNPFGTSALNNTDLDMAEVRAGGGVAWKVVPGLSIELDGGALIFREFNYHSPGIRIVNTTPAPYGQIAIRGGF